LDCWLNLLWLAITVSAVIAFGRREWRRVFTVFLATVALFPIVSDSDDLFSFARMRIPVPHHRDAGTAPEDRGEKDTVQLARLLETLDQFQIAAACDAPPAFFAFALLLCLICLLRTRFVLASAGRAPPLGLHPWFLPR
jgi:hypothetical protein